MSHADPNEKPVEERSTRPTERFERQHVELTALAKALVAELDTRKLSADPLPARRALAAFSGKLRVHAAMEQNALYPRLLASPDPRVSLKARELELEVGALYETFFAYLDRFRSAEAIRADAEEFVRTTMMQLHLLGQRMKRENRELYPLVDALEDERAPATAR